MILMNISYMFQTKSLKNCIVIFNLLTASGHWQSWTCHDHEACVDSLEHIALNLNLSFNLATLYGFKKCIF